MFVLKYDKDGNNFVRVSDNASIYNCFVLPLTKGTSSNISESLLKNGPVISNNNVQRKNP